MAWVSPPCKIVKGGYLSPVRHKAADPYGANPCHFSFGGVFG